MGGGDRRSVAHWRDAAACLRPRPRRPSRACGAGPARRHAHLAGAGRSAAQERGSAARAGSWDPCRDRRAAAGGGAACGDPGRLGLDGRGAGGDRRMVRAQPYSGGAVVPAQGPAGQRKPQLHRRPWPAARSQARAAPAGRRPRPGPWRPPRRQSDPGLHPVSARRDGPAPGSHPSRSKGAGAGLAGRRRRGGRSRRSRPGPVIV